MVDLILNHSRMICTPLCLRHHFETSIAQMKQAVNVTNSSDEKAILAFQQIRLVSVIWNQMIHLEHLLGSVIGFHGLPMFNSYVEETKGFLVCVDRVFFFKQMSLDWDRKVFILQYFQTVFVHSFVHIQKNIEFL